MDVIIPTYRPGEKFNRLIERLLRQTVLPQRILVANTEEALWNASEAPKGLFERGVSDNGVRLSLFHVAAEEFDHGGTRARAAALCSADVLLFMTQDADPADPYLLERLLAALEQEKTAAVYARQLADRDAGPLERCSRNFNYGGNSRVKSLEDLPELGIKAFFCSNVCAAYDRRVYESLGGFERRAIFNEDMIFASRLLEAGYRVAYAADARVIHSHNYSGRQQFQRNFDLAVSQADHPEIFADLPSEGEGLRLVKGMARYSIRSARPQLLLQIFWQSACKYLGYLCGKNYRRLPQRLVKAFSMNKNYWNKIF